MNFNNELLRISMKLIKFMPLNNSTYFCRAKKILETNKFWCTYFYELNDPMEGIFQSPKNNKKKIEDMCSLKEAHFICSFSHISSLGNPLLWGYYAAGFKGIAIEVEIDCADDDFIHLENDSYIQKIKYEQLADILDSDKSNNISINTVFGRKLCNWQHENEYRFIAKASKPGSYEIKINQFKRAKIEKVHFGNPYEDIDNRDTIVNKCNSLKKYELFKKELIEVCNTNGIEHAFFNPWMQHNCNCFPCNCNKRIKSD